MPILNPSLDRERTSLSPWSNIFPARPGGAAVLLLWHDGRGGRREVFAEGCCHVLCDNVAAFQLVTICRGALGGRRAWTPTASAWSRWVRTAAVPCTGTSMAHGCTRRTRCRGNPTESWLQTGNSPPSPYIPPCLGAGGAQRSQPGWRGLRLTAVVSGTAAGGA